MKRCPECQKTYTEADLNFCLDDGEWLVADGQADEPKTAILSVVAGGLPDREAATKAQLHSTDQTAILPSIAEAEPQSNSGAPPEKQSFSANRAAKPLAALVVAALILVGGYYGYKYLVPNNQINSIAVLPFENRSGDPDSDYLSDGLAESLIYRLSQLPDLKVSPTSSVFRYKGKETDPQVVAKELGVDSVMTGRITQRGDNLTISVNLVDTRNGKSLWGEQYERKMSELLTTQREIASEITNKLRLKLSGESEQKLAKKYTTSNEAYQLYLRGRYHFARRTKDDIFKAIEYYERAIKLDSDFALAYAHLADLYNHVPNYPYISPNESVPKAKQAARRALEIDPQLPEAYAALANSLAAYDWDWVEAERSFKKAIELDPNNALVRYRYATEYLLVTGRDKEAIAEVERATELDPLDINIATGFSRIYIYSGEPEKALEQARKVNDLDPNFIVGQWILCRSYNLNGLYEDTIKLGNEVVKKNPDNQVILAYLGVAYAKSSRREEAEEVIKRFREIEKTGHVISYLIAQIYIALNDRNSAFAELNRAFEKKDTWLKLAKVDPFLKDLRQDPRYKDLLKRMNLPE